MVMRVVVPLDGSDVAARAIGPAHALAERTGAELVLLSTRWDDGVGEARDALNAQAAEIDYERTATTIVHDRAAAPAILMAADEPGVTVCMSTHGRGGLGRALLGSVTEEVLRHATHPILLVGPSLDRGAWQSEHWFVDAILLVAVDGSPASEAVVPAAADWGRMLDLQPRVVEVLPAPIGILVDRHDDATETAEARRVAEALDSVERPSQHTVLHGADVAAALLDCARGLPVALIAMGTHGRTGLARVTLGSVAMRVVHGSACPVLIARSADLAN